MTETLQYPPFDHLPIAIMLFDSEGGFSYSNLKCQQRIKIAHPQSSLLLEDLVDRSLGEIKAAIGASEQPLSQIVKLENNADERINYRVNISLTQIENIEYFCIALDELPKKVSDEGNLFRESFVCGFPAVICDYQGEILHCNDSFSEIFSDQIDIQGCSLWNLLNLDDSGFEAVQLDLADKKFWAGSREVSFKDGSKLYLMFRIHKISAEFDHIICHILDFTQQRDTEETLEFAKHLAEQANIAKSRFLAKMSHEIRSPLNAVINMTQILMDSPLKKRERQFAKIANKGGQTLMALINDILDFSKIEAGHLEIRKAWFSLSKMMQDLVELFWLRAAEEEIELVTVTSPEIQGLCYGDETRIKQVLINIINNAIKFTKEGGIIVRLSKDKNSNSVIFEIDDTGIGMPENQLDTIFNEFSQIEDSENRRFGGTGLGLSIVKQLLDAMGGKISVQSVVGTGSKFNIKIPLDFDNEKSTSDRKELSHSGVMTLVEFENPLLEKGMIEQLQLLNARVFNLSDFKLQGNRDVSHVVFFTDKRDIILDNSVLLEVESYYNITEKEIKWHYVADVRNNDCFENYSEQNDIGFLIKPVLAKDVLDALDSINTNDSDEKNLGQDNSSFEVEQSVPLPPATILLAEDSPSNQAVALALMDWEGADICVAEDGRIAFELANQKKFDLILMDLSMPEVDGLEATALIRASKGPNNSTPIIALTANAFAEDKASCLAAGMNDYISKPIDSVIFMEKLSAWLCPDGVCRVSDESEKRRDGVVIDNDLLDTRVLEQLIADTSAEVLPKILNIYFRETEARIPEMLLTYESELWSTLGEQAHILKSSAGSFGAIKLSAQAKIIESAVKSNEISAVARAMDGLEGLALASINAHREYLSGLQNGSSTH